LGIEALVTIHWHAISDLGAIVEDKFAGVIVATAPEKLDGLAGRFNIKDVLRHKSPERVVL
jgi:hypothetical protein